MNESLLVPLGLQLLHYALHANLLLRLILRRLLAPGADAPALPPVTPTWTLSSPILARTHTPPLRSWTSASLAFSDHSDSIY